MKLIRTTEERNQHWLNLGFKNLLVWLLIYVMVGPFLEAIPYAKPILSIFLTLVLVSAIGALHPHRTLTRIGIGLLVLTLVSLWLETAGVIDLKVNLSLITLPLFLIIPIYSFTCRIFRIRRVSTNAICSALCLYLLIGLFWGFLYGILESLVPNSFSGALLDGADTIEDKCRHLQYLSYVTMSTLGYGDITPLTRGAAALCQAEAIVGQFFTIVVVARLVGIQVAQQTAPDEGA